MKIHFPVLTMLLVAVVFALSCSTNAENVRARSRINAGPPVDEGSVIVLFDEDRCPVKVVKLVDHCPPGLGSAGTICRWPENTPNRPSQINWMSLVPPGQSPKFKIVITSPPQFPCRTESARVLAMSKIKHQCIIKNNVFPSDLSVLVFKYSVIAGETSCIDNPDTTENERELDPYIVIIK